MLFSSLTFLYVFLPAVLAVYFLVPARGRNFVLLGSSLVFYAYGEPVYTLLLIFSSVLDYVNGLIIEKKRGRWAAKAALGISLAVNLGLLCFFKYTDFFIKNINAVFGSDIGLMGIALPIGISFYTFQTMSYTIDVYRGSVPASHDFIGFASYVCMFPQLVAGPIVRYSDISASLYLRKTDVKGFSGGTLRFVTGLAKKVLIANVLGELAQKLSFTVSPTVFSEWIYAAAFTLQIYYDFSGYSDMAIGLGKMLGFSFPENFDHPFMSKSVSEFWRRWHMTLGGWFRDYVYIPLGGSRVKPLRRILNVLIVWALTGFWHGAEWNFMAWGVYFAVFLVLEKFVWGNALKKCPAAAHIYTLFAVLISFVIFSADMPQALIRLKNMFGAGGVPAFSAESLYYIKSYAVVLAAGAAGTLPLWAQTGRKISASRAGVAAEPVWCAVLIVLCTAFLIEGTFNPFLYFRF